MTWLEAVGYVASILVLSTFYMKTMFSAAMLRHRE